MDDVVSMLASLMEAPPSPSTIIPQSPIPFATTRQSGDGGRRESAPSIKLPKQVQMMPGDLYLEGWRRASAQYLRADDIELGVADADPSPRRRTSATSTTTHTQAVRTCSFPLITTNRRLAVQIVLGGTTIRATVSTTRRTLTLAGEDTKDALVEEEDFVSCFPTKKCQLYCGTLHVVGAQKDFHRFDYYLSTDKHPRQSRLGILPHSHNGRRDIFAHSRLSKRVCDAVGLHGLSDQSPYTRLVLGTDALPPTSGKGVAECLLTLLTQKEIPCLGVTGLSAGTTKSVMRREPIPTLFDSERRGLLLPRRLYAQFVPKGREYLRLTFQGAGKFNHVMRILVSNKEDHPAARIAPIDEASESDPYLSFLLSSTDGECIVMGWDCIAALSRSCFAFSQSKKRAWIW